MKIMTGIIALFSASFALGQMTNLDFEKIDISPDPLNFLHADIDKIPGQKLLALSPTQSFPFYLIDSETLEIKQTYDVGNWYAGARIEPSVSGKYILLQQLFYLDYSPNKDREVKFEVIEAGTGKTVLRIDKAHAASFHPSEENLIVLRGDDVYAYSLDGKGDRKLFPVPGATNCAAISPDGTKIAISHMPEAGFLDDYLTKKKQRKNFKLYKKYRQCISVYDAKTFEKIYTVDEMYDIPYFLKFSPESDVLLCYSVPHIKLSEKSGMGNSHYISKTDARTGQYMPGGFVSNSTHEPDFEFSHSGKYVALVTLNSKYPEVWICEFETSKIIARFEVASRLLEGFKKGNFSADVGRTGLAFSEDDSILYFTAGSIIFKWNIPYENQ